MELLIIAIAFGIIGTFINIVPFYTNNKLYILLLSDFNMTNWVQEGVVPGWLGTGKTIVRTSRGKHQSQITQENKGQADYPISRVDELRFGYDLTPRDDCVYQDPVKR